MVVSGGKLDAFAGAGGPPAGSFSTRSAAVRYSLPLPEAGLVGVTMRFPPAEVTSYTVSPFTSLSPAWKFSAVAGSGGRPPATSSTSLIEPVPSRVVCVTPSSDTAQPGFETTYACPPGGIVNTSPTESSAAIIGPRPVSGPAPGAGPPYWTIASGASGNGSTASGLPTGA